MDDPLRAGDRQRRMGTHEFATALMELGSRYNQALLVVENNSAAGGAVATRLGLNDRYRALYCEAGADMAGARTTDRSKSAYVAAFKSDLADDTFTSYDERVPRDMANFIVLDRNTATGHERMAARPGTHDDLMMAVLIANAHRRHAFSTALSNSRPLIVKGY